MTGRAGGRDAAATGGRVPDASFEALAKAVGSGHVERHAPVVVDGVALDVTLRPPDGDALARALAALGELGLAAIVRGGGTQLALGNPPSRGDVLLSTERIAGTVELDAQDGVVLALAGTPVAALADETRAAGWQLPLETARAGGTLGGALATAFAGPRLLGLGRPRDAVLGLAVSLASGERTKCGGRVVKNVTGYDMAKLYTGSLGGLGVIESAWIRLRPEPASRVARCLLSRGGPPSADATSLALAASRRTSARTVAWVSPALAARHGLAPGGGTWLLLAEYAGDEASVAHDVAWLEAQGDAASLACVAAVDDAVDRLGAAQSAGAIRARIACLPTRIRAACAPLEDAGVGIVAHPGTGLVYAVSDDANGERVLRAVDAGVAAARGDLRFEALPLPAKRARDVFGDPGPRAPLLRALKAQFDPAGTLNPGRGQGRV